MTNKKKDSLDYHKKSKKNIYNKNKSYSKKIKKKYHNKSHKSHIFYGGTDANRLSLNMIEKKLEFLLAHNEFEYLKNFFQNDSFRIMLPRNAVMFNNSPPGY